MKKFLGLIIITPIIMYTLIIITLYQCKSITDLLFQYM